MDPAFEKPSANSITRRACLAQDGDVVDSTLMPIPSMQANLAPETKIRVAVIFTAFTYRSHAHVTLENFLKPYLFCGKRVEPQMEIVSLWGDHHRTNCPLIRRKAIFVFENDSKRHHPSPLRNLAASFS